MTVKIKVSVSQHALLSGCDGGNGVYSFFTLFFFGSRRLAKFLWRNLGKNRSQLWDCRSGSLASSRLIISVCGNIKKKRMFELVLHVQPALKWMWAIHALSSRLSHTLACKPREVWFQSAGQNKDGWHHGDEVTAERLSFSLYLPWCCRLGECSSSCPSRLFVPGQKTLPHYWNFSLNQQI